MSLYRRILSVAHSICNLKYGVPKEAFHNGCSYDSHPIVKEFEKQVICLGENTEKYISFSVSKEREITRIDKKGNEITKIISYILEFTDGPRFMTSLLSDLFNIVAEGIHKFRYT